MGQYDSLTYILTAVGLLFLAFVVFNLVRTDYRVLGRLSRPISWLQVGFFCVYAGYSYVFLDSRLDHISASGWLLALAIVLMVVGFAAVLFTMPKLGKRSFGHEVGRLDIRSWWVASCSCWATRRCGHPGRA
jgi:amino acid permease